MDAIVLHENDMGETLEVEIHGEQCKFYYTEYDEQGNEVRKLTKTISLDYLSGATF